MGWTALWRSHFAISIKYIKAQTPEPVADLCLAGHPPIPYTENIGQRPTTFMGMAAQGRIAAFGHWHGRDIKQCDSSGARW
jgi:hypothetical protein